MKLNGKRWKKITTVNTPPVAGNTGEMSFELPQDKRIHWVEVICTLAAGISYGAAFDKVYLDIGNTQREVPITEYASVQNFLGGNSRSLGVIDPGPAGGRLYLPIPFSDPSHKDIIQSDRGALDIVPGVKAQVRLGWKSVATAPSNFRINVLQEDLADLRFSQAPLNLADGVSPILHRWHRNTLAAAGQTQPLDDIQEFQQDTIDSVHFFDPTGAIINRITLDVDGEIVFDRYKSDNDIDLLRAGYAPEAGRFDIVPSAFTEKLTDAWRQMGRAGSVKWYFEYADGPDGTAATASGNVVYVLRTWGGLR